MNLIYVSPGLKTVNVFPILSYISPTVVFGEDAIVF